MPDRRLPLLFLLILLVGCNPFATKPPAASLETFGPWTVANPALDQPPMAPSGDGSVHLDPRWKIDSVKVVYRWYGLVNETVNAGRIYREGNTLLNSDGGEVTAEVVQALYDGMQGFYPTQFELLGMGRSDDYASRIVEIVGTDGARLMIVANNTDNFGFGPWNLMVNGQRWAQFNDTLSPAIEGLFRPQSEIGQVFDFLPLTENYRPFRPQRHGDGDDIAFATEPPASLEFEGFAEMRNMLRYGGATEDELEVVLLTGRNISWPDKTILGTVNAVEMVLTLPDGSEHDCIASEDSPSEWSDWRFACPVPNVRTQEGNYRLPLQITMHTTRNETFGSDGVLVGLWEELRAPNEGLLLTHSQIPSWLAAALETNAQSKSLLAAHRPVSAQYMGRLLPGETPQQGRYIGDLLWVGWREVGERTIPYTIVSRFSYEDGQLYNWTADAQTVQQLLDDVLAQPLTQRLLRDEPALKVNLFYAERDERQAPEVKNAGSNYRGFFDWELGQCEGLPGPIELPADNQPLRAFWFDDYGYDKYLARSFVLLDGRTVVYEYDYRDERDRGTYAQRLLPPLVQEELHQFRAIRQDGGWAMRIPSIGFYPADNADKESVAEWLMQLPATEIREWPGGAHHWALSELTFMVDDDGHLQLHDCNPTNAP